MIEQFKSIFKQRTALELAQAELAEAQRSRLQALSAAEYAQSLSQYHAKRIERLRHYIESEVSHATRSDDRMLNVRLREAPLRDTAGVQ